MPDPRNRRPGTSERNSHPEDVFDNNLSTNPLLDPKRISSTGREHQGRVQ